MLGIFKDSALKLLASTATPKRFLLPLKGGSSSSALFIGDPYTCTVTATAAIGAASISLNQTFELSAPGLLTIGAQTIWYTSLTATSVAGIPATGAGSITSSIASGAVAVPNLIYTFGGSLRVDPVGIDQGTDVNIQLKRSNQTAFNFPNTPALYSQTTVNSGVSQAVEVDAQVNALAGVQQEFTNFSLVANSAQPAENLLLKSEQLDDPVWLKATTGATAAPTVTANVVVDPNGNLTADQISFPATDVTSQLTVAQSITVPVTAPGSNYCCALWIRADVAINSQVALYARTGGPFGFNWANTISNVALVGNQASPNITTSWQQIFYAGDAGLNSQQATITLVIRQPASSPAVVVYVSKVQLNHGLSIAPYVTTTTLPQGGRPDSTVTLQAPLYVFRRDQALPQSLRLFPLTRQVKASLPGLILGQYRWRDKDTINESTIVPTQWDQDVVALGIEKFASGIGHGDDLDPQGLIEQNDSIFLQVKHGAYFSGPFRHYLPSGKALEFFAATGTGPVLLTLGQQPRPQTPVFVGAWKLDTQGYYESDIEYRYMSSGIALGPTAPAYQYTLDRKNRLITINQAPASQILFLGTISGQQTDYFDLPSYPVDRVDRVYIDRGLAGLPVDSSNWVFDRDQGTIRVTNPASATAGPSIPGGLSGEAVFAQVQRAVAVEYETGNTDTLTVDSVDLNPAFSGLAQGYVYLQHRRQKADTIQLTADKPSIAIPPTHDTIVGLTAYGPVFFDGDYAMLIAKAFSQIPGEIVPNIRMRAVLDPTTFTGLLNYRNPVATITAATRASGVATYTSANAFQAGDTVTISALSDATFNGVFTVATATAATFTVNMAQPAASLASQAGFAVIDIDVVTGGDGTANLIYIPQSGYGVWAPTTAAGTPVTSTSLAGVKTTVLTNDTLVLPTPIPISQLWNAKEGWLVTLYSILNNDPLFGLVGANTALGQIPFTTQGTPGTAAYKTNGERSPWTSGSGGSAPVLPIKALDINGVDHLVGGFTGSVKQLQYGQALPVPTGLAAYFISFVQRVAIQLQAIGSNVFSSPVLLQMAVPDVLVQNPWLRLEDDTQGRINQFRLGWVKSTPLFGPTR